MSSLETYLNRIIDGEPIEETKKLLLSQSYRFVLDLFDRIQRFLCKIAMYKSCSGAGTLI